MSRKRIIGVFVLTFIMLGVLCPGWSLAADGGRNIDVVILHMNDLHGNLIPMIDKKMAPEPEKVGGAAYITGLIKKEKEAKGSAVILMNAGDLIPLPKEFSWEPVTTFVKDAGFDVSTLGNHDFDRGQAELAKIVKALGHPVICANVVDTNGRFLPNVKPYLIKEVNGIKLGIIGLLTPTTPAITQKKNVAGLEFLDPIATTERYLPILKSKGARLIIVLSHLGVKDDEKLAQNVRGIDVIVGSHTHKVITDPEVVNGTIILQAGSEGKYIGELSLQVEPVDYKIVGFTAKNELIPVLDTCIKPDPEVLAIVKKFETEIAPLMNKVVGEALEDFSKTPSAGFSDSQMGNLIADSMREKTGSDIAFANSGGIRSVINKGTIKVETLYAVSPFPNYMAAMDLTGDKVLEVLENGFSGNVKGFVQVSGAEVVYDLSKPEGSRIVEVKIGGAALDPKKTYRVSTVDFMANGGESYKGFLAGKNRVDTELARDVLGDYIKAHSPIKPVAPGRLRPVQ
ncbi:MAG: bifunctional UDP-sugar hydrolase/5'-nucleotidase [bacterium]